MGKTAYLVMQNGEVFKGENFADDKEVVGEVVFTTAMTGYMETLSDPSYYGQIVVHTYPLIGNYGVIREDCESENVYIKGYIVKEICDFPSNFRSQGKYEDFLLQKKVTGLKGIDTRALTIMVREKSVMNGIITKDPHLTPEQLELLNNYKITNALDAVSTKEPLFLKAENPKYNIVLMDYGRKLNIERSLIKRGCNVTVLPHDTKAEDVLKYKPDGIMLSNGPGDPSDDVFEIEQLKKLYKSGVPIFGICLGHQLLALSQGAKTYKLKYGHRGINQSVKFSENGKVYITSQNHGYAVETTTLPKDKAEAIFINVNDNTCEGVQYKDANVFSTQFHPEACPGPQDTEFLFDKFLDNIKRSKNL